MALTQYTADTDIIETLGTNPEDRPTLTDNTFKGKFDENAANIKAFLNAMIAELASTANGKGASQIGIEDSAGRYTATQIEAALAEIAGSGRTTETVKGLADLISTDVANLATHKAETVSKATSATRDISIVGTQKISLPFAAKSIELRVFVGTTKMFSLGYCDNTLAQNAMIHNPDTDLNYTAGTAIQLYCTAYNVSGTISLIENDGFTITWAKISGTVPSTTAQILVLAHTH